MYPLPGKGQAGTYTFPHIFRPFEQNATFLPAYTFSYTQSGKKGNETIPFTERYIHT
jgi:hypothetical protein